MSRLSPLDPSSYSRPEEVVVTHIELDWTVDFKHKVIEGLTILSVERKDDKIDHLVLDTRELNIKSVQDQETSQDLKFTLGKHDSNFGSELKIILPADSKKVYTICIKYETSPKSSALQWLEPEQTAGKEHPYLFSQCQAIHCRSLLPCQDTPNVKATYTAKVKCTNKLVVLMSALREGKTQEGENTVYKFRQPVPMPSYLIAIAVGALESRSIGPRSNVWSEKEFVEKAKYEFAETETMLKTAEELCGPYVWTQYDLLILPPSFPYGGMENPCLTFVTPTLLAGDRSLADVVAHEISHSWTGNLVTNNQWEHFWLNEGFTMFIERKIAGRMHGEKMRHFAAIGGWKELYDCIKTRGKDDPLTCLVPDLTGVDPDDSFSTVPYEKGHTFLWYLETLVGGPDAFEPFLKTYLDKYKYKSIDSETFKSFLLSYFADKSKVFDEVDWKAWWKTPGMPPIKPEFSTTLADVCSSLCTKWVQWQVTQDCPFTKADLAPLSSVQIREFLAELLEQPALSIEKLKKMDEIYKFGLYKNSEIKFRWLRLCLHGHWDAYVEEALMFITEQGRMKYIRPIYRDLYAWEGTRDRAIATFKKNRDSMMHVAAYVVEKDLHLRD